MSLFDIRGVPSYKSLLPDSVLVIVRWKETWLYESNLLGVWLWIASSLIVPMSCKTGTDVARKVVILARECNLKVELEDVEVQSLVPQPLRDSPSAEAFLESLPQVSAQPTSVVTECADAHDALYQPHCQKFCLPISHSVPAQPEIVAFT